MYAYNLAVMAELHNQVFHNQRITGTLAQWLFAVSFQVPRNERKRSEHLFHSLYLDIRFLLASLPKCFSRIYFYTLDIVG